MSTLRRAVVTAVSAAAVASGLTAYLRRRRHRRGDFRVFLLEYHDVTDGAEREGVVSEARFRAHLRHLKRHYRVESLAGALELLRNPERLDADRVVVTFDDGYVGNFEHGFRVLQEEGLPGVVYVTTGFLDGTELWFDYARRALRVALAEPASLSETTREILALTLGTWPYAPGASAAVGRLKYVSPERRAAVIAALRADVVVTEPAERPLTWDQVRELVAAGFEIGAHTVTHPILSGLSPDAQAEEIRGSAERIEQETGVRPVFFAIPNGSSRDYDEDTVRILPSLGFESCCTTERGSNAPGCDLFTLRRIGVGSDAIAVLEARLAGLFDENVRSWSY